MGRRLCQKPVESQEASATAGHQDRGDTTLPAWRHVWFEGWGGFGIELAAWWLLVQECILSISSCSHPTLFCCVLLGAGAGRMHRDFFCYRHILSPRALSGWPHSVLKVLPAPELTSGFLWLLGTGCGPTAETTSREHAPN